jgi:hypothetical protein
MCMIEIPWVKGLQCGPQGHMESVRWNTKHAAHPSIVFNSVHKKKPEKHMT